MTIGYDYEVIEGRARILLDMLEGDGMEGLGDKSPWQDYLDRMPLFQGGITLDMVRPLPD